VEPTPIPATAKWPDRALLAAFLLVALGAPWIDTLVRDDEARSPREPELRIPEARPEWKWDARALWKYPSQYEKHFQDSFGLRDQLLRAHSLQTLKVFDTSPSPLVFFGKDHWMFYRGDATIPVYRGMRPFPSAGPDSLAQFLESLRARQEWLARIGCQHLLVIAPNKESVYPERMPDAWTRVGPTRLDELVAAAKADGRLHVLDLRTPLAAAKAEDKPGDFLYYEEGTHWNGRGSLVAYAALLNELGRSFEGLAPKPASAFERIATGGNGETWRRSMYIADTSRQTDWIFALRPAERRARVVQDSGWGRGRVRISRTDDPALPTALILHDSFGPYIEEPLSEHFREMRAIWDYQFPGEALLEMRPSIMIEIWVERALVFLFPDQLRPAEYAELSGSFAQARTRCWTLNGASPDSDYEALSGLSIRKNETPGGAVLDLELENLAGSLLLPPIPPGRHSELLLELEIDSPVDTVADLFWLEEGMSEYSREKKLQITLVRGRNRSVVRIPEDATVGRIRLRPGFVAPQTYRLRSAELRAN
jgi:hypothetical protein